MVRSGAPGSDAPGGPFVVHPDHAGERLDVFLAAQLRCPRGQAQKAIEQGRVTVSGRRARASHKLRAGEHVEVAPGREPATAPAADEPADVEADGEKISLLAVAPEPLPLTALFEDDDLLVLAKPAGLVVHPAGEITGGTLANAVAHRWGTPPGLVHRLDRDTSGVMVVARTALAQQRLVTQFREHTVRKEYVALVYGKIPDAQGRIDAALRRDRKNRLKMVTCPADEGRSALTLYTVRAAWSEVTLLDVEIRTGRTHQIRVHCAHLGHPVVADEMYGKGRAEQVRDGALRAAIQAVGRQALHAARLSFDHPTSGARLTFEAPLDADLQALLAAASRGAAT